MSAWSSIPFRIASVVTAAGQIKRGSSQAAAVLMAGFCLPLAAGAEPMAGNVTRGGFTLFWESETEGLPEVRVYSDSAGADPVEHGIRREAFPLAEAPGAHFDVHERAARRELREVQAQRGLMAVRVGGLDPDTVYFIEAGMRDELGVYQAEGDDLIEVRTAPETPFVADYRQVIVDFEDETAAGAVAVLRAEGALAPLVAVVGDSAGGAARARFALSGLLDEDTGGAFAPGENWSFTVTRHAGDTERPAMPAQAPHDGDFRIAGTTTFAFEMPIDVEIAEFVFDPIGDQMVGQPFAVTIVARDAAGEVAHEFSGTVELTANGALETGASTGAFEDGVLEGHPVTIGKTGDFELSASLAASGAEGTSNLFAVMTDWENWMALSGQSDGEDSLRQQRLADPDGSGQPALMRYGFDLPFDDYEAAPVEQDTVEEDGERYLTVTFRRLQYAPDVRYLVMGSDDLNGWEVIEVVEPGSPEWVTVADEKPIGEDDSRFLRVGLLGGDTFEFWRAGEFGTADLNDPEITGKYSDPGDYGVSNLQRYALGMGGPEPDLGKLPERRIVTENGYDYQELRFERLPAGEDVLYRVEVTSDFPNWELIEEFGPGLPTAMGVRDSQPLPETGYRVMRLVVLEAQ